MFKSLSQLGEVGMEKFVLGSVVTILTVCVTVYGVINKVDVTPVYTALGGGLFGASTPFRGGETVIRREDPKEDITIK